MTVSFSVSPFSTLEPEPFTLTTSADRRLPASSNEVEVRVEGDEPGRSRSLRRRVGHRVVPAERDHQRCAGELGHAGTQPLFALLSIGVVHVAGIGDPDRFFSMLRGQGIAVVPHAFPDHHRYRAEDLRFGSDLPVLLTEKDAVKCAALAGERWYSVGIDARLPEAFWVALLGRLPTRSSRPAQAP